jgi:hypothetical protein
MFCKEFSNTWLPFDGTLLQFIGSLEVPKANRCVVDCDVFYLSFCEGPEQDCLLDLQW